MWARKSTTGGSRPDYERNPVEIRVRWDDEMVEFIDAYQRRAMSNAIIMSPTEMPLGYWIWKGTLAEWQALPTYPARPDPTRKGYEIVKTQSRSDFSGDDLLFQAYV